MQQLMLRLDALVRRRRAVVITAWVALLVAAVPFAAKQSEHLTGGGFGVPGSQSKAVEDALAEQFPQRGGSSLSFVLIPQRGAGERDVEAALAEVDAAARAVDGIGPQRGAGARALARFAKDPSAPLIVPAVTQADDLASTDIATDLRERLEIADRETGAVGVHLVGQGALWAALQDLTTEDLEAAERTGFPLVALILLAVFGSLAAAALPLALGVFSVGITGAVIFFLSQATEMSVFVTSMASMIGIGVAVDYSLFVLARYREEVRAGREPDEARAVAMATSGLAVLFSGLTVIVALAGLFLVPTTALRSMALGAILVVAISMLASATLLPALMSVLGHRAYARGRMFTVAGLVARSRARRRRGSTSPDAPVRAPFWERHTARVSRRPALSAIAAAALLIVLALPALGMETRGGALRQFPDGHEVVRGFTAAAQVAGPGAGSPLRAVVDSGDARAARATIARDPEIVRVAEPVRSTDGEQALLVAEMRRDAEAPESKAAVVRLREQLPRADIGGVSALQEDFTTTVSGSLWKIALFVLGLSFLVLLVLLRSVVLPLKAAIMNLLSVGAAYGVLVVVFQWGWIDGFLGFQSPGHIDTITPPLILAVVFGLSMDYEVFLLSRIRERYAATGDTRRAVAEGLAASARTITSAALIMVAVFAVFVGTGVPSIKQLGLGNAVAIAIDATLVRLVLVPAAMELLGAWNWWLPRPLARILPATSIEELSAEVATSIPARGRRRAHMPA